jgi:hypothetical protein
VATEAADTPAARSLPLPFSSLGQLVQLLNKGLIENLVAVASSNLNVALGGLDNPADGAAHAARKVKGFATRVARAAHAGPRAAAQTIASSETGTTLMITAHVPFEMVFQAFLAILEPERQRWEDLGVSQVTRGQFHQTKGWILDGRNKLLAPHTSGPRDVPRCGALSLLQKDAALQGGASRNRCRLNVKLRTSVTDCVVRGASFFTP